MKKKSFSDLQAYIQHLESIGDLKRIKAEVDPILEITEVYSRVVKERGPALIFENVKGSPFPLAINLFGTEERVELALGRKPREVGEELVFLFEKLNPPSLRSFLSIFPKALGLLSMRTKNVGKGIVQEVSEEPDLDKLPIIKCWPKDGGRFITLGLVLTQDPITKRRNLGIYRMQLFEKKTAAMHWHPHKGGAAHYHEASKLGMDLEAAVILGGDPKMIFTAIAPLPEGMDELAFASYLRGNPIPMVRGKSISLRVPANAEFIIEGIVPQGETRVEGPFGDHFGHYSMEADFPVFKVKEITRRHNAIYPATVVGKPPKEDIFLGIAAAEMFSPLVRIIQPEVKDMWAYPESGFHNLLVVSVDERYPKNGIKAMLALWGIGQLLLTKCMIMVSSDINPIDFRLLPGGFLVLKVEKNPKDNIRRLFDIPGYEDVRIVVALSPDIDIKDDTELIWGIFTRFDPYLDVIFERTELRGSAVVYGGRMGIDATFKEWYPEVIEMSEDIKKMVTERWQDYWRT